MAQEKCRLLTIFSLTLEKMVLHFFSFLALSYIFIFSMTSFRTVLYLLLRFLCNVINLTFNFKSVVRKGVRRNLFFFCWYERRFYPRSISMGRELYFWMVGFFSLLTQLFIFFSKENILCGLFLFSINWVRKFFETL